jgi:processive 1,2-diacylglycerol beta-glucosyltransferase
VSASSARELPVRVVFAAVTPPTPRKLLLLSVSAGAGHVRAAQAIEAAAKSADPPFDATHLDLLSIVPAEFRKFYGAKYLELVEKSPQLWSWLYAKSDRPSRDSLLGALKRAAEKVNTRKLDGEIERLQPDVIFCTHFLPAELLSRQRAKSRGKASRPALWVQVTDFDVHALWVHPHVDRYCVASEEVAFRLADRGVPREKISVTGIPVMPQFSTTLDRATCAGELGIDAKKFTVLMMAGGGGVGALDELAERLLREPRELQLVALAGRNEVLLKKLRALAKKHPGRLFPQGFTTTVERIMTAADLVITKPGGLSTSECLAKRKPMLLVSPIPGQEERNADYLLEAGAAVKAVDAATLDFKLGQLLADPRRLTAMSDAAGRIGTPHAARDVVALLARTP